MWSSKAGKKLQEFINGNTLTTQSHETLQAFDAKAMIREKYVIQKVVPTTKDRHRFAHHLCYNSSVHSSLNIYI